MSAQPEATPNHAAGSENEPQKNDTVPLKIFGAEVPLPHWAVSILAVFIVVCFPVFLFFSLKHMHDDGIVDKENSQKIGDLTKAKDDLTKTNNDLASAKKRLQEFKDRETEA